MHENKQRFELAAKIVGLILIAGGLCMALDAILIASKVKDTLVIFKSLGAAPADRQPLEAFTLVERDIWKSVYFVLVFESIAPIVLGMYLLKPGNLFSRYSYPQSDRPERGHLIADGFDSSSLSDPEADERPFVIGALSNEAQDFTQTSPEDAPALAR